MTAEAWDRACRALDLLACNPTGLRGMVIRARAGPVRDTYLAALSRLPGPLIKLHPAMPRDALLGGLDLSQTLSSGHLVETKGLLRQAGTWLLTMAERCPPDLAAILAAALDDQPEAVLVLLDEGAELDERAPAVLAERLAFSVALDGIGRLEAVPPPVRTVSASATAADKDVETLTMLAARFGIHSLRVPHAPARRRGPVSGRAGREAVSEEDVRIAAELVLAPRATQMPDAPEAEAEQPEEAPPKEPSEAQGEDRQMDIPDEILVDAVRALLPSDLLEHSQSGGARGAKGSGAGQKKKGNRRGRPLPSRPGRLDGSARLDLVATLRAAAPWQRMRKRGDGPVKVLPSDIHLKRYEEKSDRLVIFAVDASGSAALARLAEAKGAVELLLGQAYSARDHVALVAFRGTEADLLLPPTRSLVQTKRRLAGLPGGGGTPLALGLKAAGEMALQAKAQGLSPMLALLTDGRANIALDGGADRKQAAEDANKMAGWLRAEGVPAVVLDMGNRPHPQLADLSRHMGATYMPLPRADAQRLNTALGQVMADGLGA
ncbi:MAG: magnesium chelatase subunit D [Pseudomonadota bacterium]